MSEAIVSEMRASRLDLLARAKFAKDEELIYESRDEFEELLTPGLRNEVASANVLQEMMDQEWVEVGE